jgi:ribonuclease-3
MTFDAKTALQEAAVRAHGEVPVYRVASSGPDHDKRFTAHVFIAGDPFGSGTGRSKKEAEQHAAREALDKLEEADDARAS